MVLGAGGTQERAAGELCGTISRVSAKVVGGLDLAGQLFAQQSEGTMQRAKKNRGDARESTQSACLALIGGWLRICGWMTWHNA